MLREGNDLQPCPNRPGKAKRRDGRLGVSEARPSAGGSAVPLRTASLSGNGRRGAESPLLSNVFYLWQRAVHQDFIKDARALWGHKTLHARLGFAYVQPPVCSHGPLFITSTAHCPELIREAVAVPRTSRSETRSHWVSALVTHALGAWTAEYCAVGPDR